MQEIREKIKRFIEEGYKSAVEEGTLDSTFVTMRIWNFLIEKDVLNFNQPDTRNNEVKPLNDNALSRGRNLQA